MTPRVSTIIMLCCAEFAVTEREIVSPRRGLNLVQARHVAMFLAKRLTGQSLAAIGMRFGDRDHTTVLHAVRRIEGLMAGDVALRRQVKALETAALEAVAMAMEPMEREAA